MAAEVDKRNEDWPGGEGGWVRVGGRAFLALCSLQNKSEGVG